MSEPEGLFVDSDGYVVDPEHPWLGGYRPGGDPFSHYPEMWTWVIEKFNVRSVADVGCGEGHSLDFFESLGCTAIGIDGIPQDDPRIVAHDYTLGPYSVDECDLVWSCEFVEHVEEQFVQNFLATFACGDLLLMTHAFPGQGGYHHVNCRDDVYWIDVVSDVGFNHDEELTKTTRSMTGTSYYGYTGLAFKKGA